MDLLLRRRMMISSKKDYIEFADPEVLRVLLANGVGDGIGITYADAAAVTSLNKMFQNNTTITTFNELRYFTGLTVVRNITGMSNLKAITFPSSLTVVPSRQFALSGQTSSLQKLSYINDNPISFGVYAFQYGTISDGVYITNLDNWLHNTYDNNTSNPLNKGHRLFLNNVEVTSVVVPSDITAVGLGWMQGCTSITSVTFHNRITSIGASAFTGCSGLTSLTIPSSVTSIGNDAFANCTSLSGTFIMPSSVTSLGTTLLQGDTNLTNVYWYNDVPSRGILYSSNTNVGNGTGLLYVSGDFNAHPSDYYFDFKQIIIDGDLRITGYGNRYFNRSTYTEIVRIGGNIVFGTYTGNAVNGPNSNVKFLEIIGNISDMASQAGLFFSLATNAILHFGKVGVACPPDKIVRGGNLSRIIKIYVGDGSSAAHDDAILAQYLADTDWSAYSAKLDTWYNYVQGGGEYATPPTIPAE